MNPSASCYSQASAPVAYVEFFGSAHVGFPMSQLRKYALTISSAEDGSEHGEHLTVRFGEDEFATIVGQRLKLLLQLLRNHTLVHVAKSIPEEGDEPDAPWVDDIIFGPMPQESAPQGETRPVRTSLHEHGQGNYMPLP